MADPLRRTLSKLRGRRSQRGAAAGTGHRHGGICAPQGKCLRTGLVEARLRGSGCSPVGGRSFTCAARVVGSAGTAAGSRIRAGRAWRGALWAPGVRCARARRAAGRVRSWAPVWSVGLELVLGGSICTPAIAFLRGVKNSALNRRLLNLRDGFESLHVFLVHDCLSSFGFGSLIVWVSWKAHELMFTLAVVPFKYLIITFYSFARRPGGIYVFK